jgi:hypothetical protein
MGSRSALYYVDIWWEMDFYAFNGVELNGTLLKSNFFLPFSFD